MKSSGYASYSDRVEEYASKLAKASLFLFLFFLFFGTTLPFQERIKNLEDVATENPLKQILFSSLYLVSFISLLPKKSLAIEILKKEKYLGLFLLWLLFTVSWSDFPLVSLKRWLQTAGVTIIFVSAFLHFQSDNQPGNYVRAVLFAYIPLSLLSILLIPGAIQWEFPAWRGFAPHKNTLGQVSLLSLIIWSATVFNRGTGKKILSLVFVGLSLILLVGSRSTTSILTCGILFLLAGALYTDKTIVRPVVGPIFSPLLIIIFFAPLVLLLSSTMGSPDALFGLFGKDMTFTGRVDIWSSILDEIKGHWIIGCGFQGFWMTNKPALAEIYYDLQWEIPHAHQGYLDILNETGIVGLSIFFVMMLSYFKNLWARGKSHPWSWVVLGVLILNLTESTLFRSDDVSGALFLFAYLTLYADQTRADPADPGAPTF